MNPRTDPPSGADAAAPTPPREARQRWRIVVARDPLPGDQIGRPMLDAWQDALVASALPVAGLDAPGGRARLSFGAPLGALAAGEAELVDVWLTERLPLWQLREALAPRLPPGFRWVAAESVWLGEPPLPGQVAAAEWRVTVSIAGGRAEGPADLASAAERLLERPSILRRRGKPGAEKPYDLRPLIVMLDVEESAAVDRAVLRLRTRLDPERGTGRPEEVVAALAEVSATDLEIVELVRTRLVLASEVESELD